MAHKVLIYFDDDTYKIIEELRKKYEDDPAASFSLSAYIRALIRRDNPDIKSSNG